MKQMFAVFLAIAALCVVAAPVQAQYGWDGSLEDYERRRDAGQFSGYSGGSQGRSPFLYGDYGRRQHPRRGGAYRPVPQHPQNPYGPVGYNPHRIDMHGNMGYYEMDSMNSFRRAMANPNDPCATDRDMAGTFGQLGGEVGYANRGNVRDAAKGRGIGMLVGLGFEFAQRKQCENRIEKAHKQQMEASYDEDRGRPEPRARRDSDENEADEDVRPATRDKIINNSDCVLRVDGKRLLKGKSMRVDNARESDITFEDSGKEAVDLRWDKEARAFRVFPPTEESEG